MWIYDFIFESKVLELVTCDKLMKEPLRRQRLTIFSHQASDTRDGTRGHLSKRIDFIQRRQYGCSII